MRAFRCPSCDRLAVFETLTCAHCGAETAFDWDRRDLVRLTTPCVNRVLLGCNGAGPVCTSCALTRTRSESAGVQEQLAKTEAAKRRLVFELLELGLPLGFTLDLLDGSTESVTIGHADGIITLDLSEADDAHREGMRVKLDEPYRTMLGHLRHEVGHYYDQVLVTDRDAYRALFGDESASYQDALDRHYAEGAPAGWEGSYVSAYATMHPFEDWAETFAHYLHLRDTLQTASSWGVNVVGPAIATADVAPLSSFPALETPDDWDAMVAAWLPLTYALNALNRSMGKDDLYPFVLTPPVLEKLAFVHALIG